MWGGTSTEVSRLHIPDGTFLIENEQGGAKRPQLDTVTCFVDQWGRARAGWDEVDNPSLRNG